jgi:CRP-like cAMP-binding protein
MENIKKLKRGEVLFKEGDQPQMVYMIQSGKIGLMLERGSKRMEVTSLGTNQVLGENGLFSTGKHTFTAEALQETKVLEVPMEMMRQQFEKSPPGVKLLVKSLVEEIRHARQQLKMSKVETEKSPCPQGMIHRIFTSLHLVVRHIGKKEQNSEAYMVSWGSLKIYLVRFFGESPQRLRQLMNLFLKLKLVEFTVTTSEEGEEELGNIKFLNLHLFEGFAEFFQYHLFKGSRAEAIYVDPLALKVAKAIYGATATAEVDHKGASRIDYSLVLNECKTKFRFDLKNTHLDALERKGLFVKRQSHDDGNLTLIFDRMEFGKMSSYWEILLEIDKWNEKGLVDLNEKEAPLEPGQAACPDCQSPIVDTNKFCPNCGARLAAA